MEKYNKILPYQVPDDYFRSLPDGIMAAVRAAGSEADQEAFFLTSADLEKGVPFSMDADYFSQLPQKIMSEVRSSEESEEWLLRQAGRDETAYLMPEGYFDGLADKVMGTINDPQKDLVNLDETLSGLADQQAYSVPDNYWDHFQVRIPAGEKTGLQAVTDEGQNQGGSAVQIRFFKAMRWSNAIAASVIFLILGLGAFIMLDNNNAPAPEDTGSMYASSAASHSEKMAYAELEGVSQKALAEYLEASMDAEDMFVLMDYYANTEKKGLENLPPAILIDVSDEDLESYLEFEGIL